MKAFTLLLILPPSKFHRRLNNFHQDQYVLSINSRVRTVRFARAKSARRQTRDASTRQIRATPTRQASATPARAPRAIPIETPRARSCFFAGRNFEADFTSTKKNHHALQDTTRQKPIAIRNFEAFMALHIPSYWHVLC